MLTFCFRIIMGIIFQILQKASLRTLRIRKPGVRMKTEKQFYKLQENFFLQYKKNPLVIPKQ